jgi:hypothetical protein
MARPYIYERQVEYRTSREIENVLTNDEFSVAVHPLTQLTERSLPTDFIFFDRQTKKLFGFQYKVLYHNGSDHWVLDAEQHRQLQSFDWIYYGLSDVTSPQTLLDALAHLRIVPVDFDYEPQLTYVQFPQSKYFRWTDFFEGLHACKYGRKMSTPEELREALWPHDRDFPPEIEQIVSEVFLVDFDNREAMIFSSIPR